MHNANKPNQNNSTRWMTFMRRRVAPNRTASEPVTHDDESSVFSFSWWGLSALKPHFVPHPLVRECVCVCVCVYPRLWHISKHVKLVLVFCLLFFCRGQGFRIPALPGKYEKQCPPKASYQTWRETSSFWKDKVYPVHIINMIIIRLHIYSLPSIV